MNKSIALLGCLLATTFIAPARAQDKDSPNKVASSEGISCEYQYSLSRLPGSPTASDHWWKTPHRLQVSSMECNGKDMGVSDQDVEVRYRQAVIESSVIGKLAIIVSGGENKPRLETSL